MDAHLRRRLGAPGALLVSLLLLALPVAVPAEAKAKREIKRCNGQATLCDRSFDQLVLPGAHNAMSVASLGWKFPNQSITIREQLDYGVRAMLIDTHYGRERVDGTVLTDDDGSVAPGVGPRRAYLCHEFCEIGAMPLAAGLRQIRKFLRAHPNNVLLIDVEDYVKPRDFREAVRRVKLNEYVYRGSTETWLTPRQMIKRRKQVVFLADNRGGGIPWYHRTYAGILQETPYSFDPPERLIRPSNWARSCGPNRGDVTGSLFLMNHWSPSTPPFAPKLGASAEVNDRAVIYNRALECLAVRGRVPSIVAVDQVTAGGLMAAVRDLNALVARRGRR